MLQLEKIKLKGIASHIESEYSFSKSLNLIFGINKDTLEEEYKELNNEDILKLSLPNLPSNGSGKSFVLEAINIAFFSEPIRKGVNLRDCIRIGFDEGEVELIAKNEWLGLEKIRIIRKFFASKTKTTQIRVFETKNGKEEEITKSSTDELNKYILNQYISISREDLSNFFIIQKDKYIPFLLQGDTKKKEIISRFTGIDQYTYIEKDLNENIDNYNKEKNIIQSEIIKLEGKNELLESQKKSLPSKEIYLKQNKDKIQEINNDISYENSKISEIIKENEDIDKAKIELKERISIAEGRVKKWIVFLNKNKYKEEKLHLQEEEKDIKDALNNLTELKNENKLSSDKKNILIKNINVILNGLIKCPKCKHKFNASDNKGEIELKEEQEQLNGDIKILNKTKSELNSDEIELKNLLEQIQVKVDLNKIKIKQINNIDFFLNESVEELKFHYENKNKEALTKNKEIQTYLLGIEESKKQIITLESKKYSEVESKIKDIDTQIESIKLSIKDKKEKEESVNNNIQNYKDSQIYFNNFKNYLYNKAIFNIEQVANYYLNRFSDLRIEILGSKLLADGKTSRDEIDCKVKQGNKEVSYFSLSSGERASIDVSFILTFQHILNTSSQNGLDYLALDECLSNIDSYNQDKLLYVLKDLNKTIDFITHINTLSQFSRTYIIKENSVSQIIEDNKNNSDFSKQEK